LNPQEVAELLTLSIVFSMGAFLGVITGAAAVLSFCVTYSIGCRAAELLTPTER